MEESLDEAEGCSSADLTSTTRKRGPYKLYALSTEDESFCAKIPRTTKWRRRCQQRDDIEFEDRDGVTIQGDVGNEELGLSNEDDDFAGTHILDNETSFK